MKSLIAQLKAARASVNMSKFGTPEWDAKMSIVNDLCDRIDAAKPAEEFCSVDSGFHRTRLRVAG